MLRRSSECTSEITNIKNLKGVVIMKKETTLGMEFDKEVLTTVNEYGRKTHETVTYKSLVDDVEVVTEVSYCLEAGRFIEMDNGTIKQNGRTVMRFSKVKSEEYSVKKLGSIYRVPDSIFSSINNESVDRYFIKAILMAATGSYSFKPSTKSTIPGKPRATETCKIPVAVNKSVEAARRAGVDSKRIMTSTNDLDRWMNA